ncbi:MAG: hypothetical protein LBV02_01400 [Bacteroidales bacterium]|jgi:outer membrane biosynthesis protein TonB|nr:hypothetical protein [Bacteroidales bacterium]
MNNFDRFIKDLGESETPEYREKYWKQFAQKAGFKTYNTAKIVVGSAITAAIVGAAFWTGFHFSKSDSSSDILWENPTPVENPVMLSDTIKIEEHQNTTEEVIEKSISPPTSPKPQKKPVSPQVSPKENPNVDTPQDEPAPATKKTRRERQTESFYFDIDTIS